ncbi:hypothetical protein [Niallia sp.]|uniref:hypothetical protein n=1 Tax=Niallia sp. TaxID=2837523 RepID=UPI002896B547|nr:hypothetical protein [Niallia sp.]
MNTFTGPFRLMMREMSLTFYINVAITFVLFAFYNILGFIGVTDAGSFILFGPLFIVFLIYPFANFSGYKYILSLGGTRKQFVLALYLTAFIYGVISVVILNLFYLITNSINNSINLLHFAELTNSSNWLVYLWVDFCWIFFLFSLGMIAKTIWFNYGTILSLSVATLLLVIGTVVVVFGDISWLAELFFTHYLQFVAILLGIAIVFLYIAYLLMKNAPLEKSDRLFIRQRKAY